MSYLGTPPQSGFITTAKQRITSSTNNYVDLDHSISSLADVIVWVNSVKQDSTNLSLTTSTRITLGGTLVSSDIVEIAYLGKAVNTQTPGTGTVTNDMLAGSIANDKLAGSIANSKLTNSSISINGNSVSLGGSITGIGEANTPYARVGFSSAPAVSNGTLKVAEYGNILFASDNSIVDTTNYKITPGVAGKYYVAAHINYAPNAVDEKDYHLLLYKNTAVIIRTATLAAGNSNGRGTDVYLSGFVELNSTDYLQMKVFQNSGANAQYAYGDTTGFQNFFETFKIAS